MTKNQWVEILFLFSPDSYSIAYKTILNLFYFNPFKTTNHLIKFKLTAKAYGIGYRSKGGKKI